MTFKRIDIEQCHGAAPDTPAVQRKDPRLVATAFKRRPVAEDDFHIARLAILVAEPRGVTGYCGADAFLALEVEFAIAGAEAHTRKIVGDDPQACDASQVVVPFGRLIAIHAVEEDAIQLVVLKCVFDFSSLFQGFFH